jgi:hypothetical protein
MVRIHWDDVTSSAKYAKYGRAGNGRRVNDLGRFECLTSK